MSEQGTPDRWRRVDELFERVLARPPAERRQFLRNLPDLDARLRDDVERLLESYRAAESFLEAPPVLSPETFEELAADFGSPKGEPPPGGPPFDGNDAPSATPGERIGPWRIVEELGRGGMATVYLVERAEGRYEQTAALKLLRRGLDTADIVHRFRAERQILSSLTHQNISRLLDGGATEDGRPYLVMERVEGVPITGWCDDRRASVEERLRLFLDVARAVHHAHTKLVVHRDLKPSNILVTDAGMVKLLDFGIAKILDPELAPENRVRTRTGHRTMTPEYASPEQLRGGPITTATDVYQLGLLLHRLLSGARPREARGDATKLIGDPTPLPTAPSRVALRGAESVAKARGSTPERLPRRLRGDLDTIVLTALEFEPERRYGSALGMAEDVERHLEGRPITARSAGRVYRMRKFLTRHRWVAPVAVGIVFLLGVYVATLIRHGRELEAERNTARAEARQAERVRDVLVDVFRSADPWAPTDPARGSNITVREALALSSDRIREELVDEPEMRAELLRAIASVYLNLGLPASARPLLEEALQVDASDDGRVPAGRTASLRLLGRTLQAQGQFDSATSLLRTSFDRSLASRGSGDTVVLATGIDLANALQLQGRYEEARDLYVRTIEGARGAESRTAGLLARAHSGLAAAYVNLGREEDALPAAERALAIVRHEFGERDPRTGQALVDLGWTLFELDRFEEAHAVLGRAIEILNRSLGEDHAKTMHARVAFSDVLTRLGRLDEAEAIKRRILDRQIDLFGEDAENVIVSLHQLSLLLEKQGRLDEAAGIARRVHAARAALRPDHYSTAWPLSLLCRIHGRTGEIARAEAECREALRIYRVSLPAGHTTIAVGECHLGRILARQGRLREAATLFDAALPIVESDPPQIPDPLVPRCLEAVSPVYEALGRDDDAERWRRKLAEVLEARE